MIADTPGHIQYTRNMVTGASTATWRCCWSTPAKACSNRPAATPCSPRCCGSRTWSSASTKWTSSTTTRRSTTRSAEDFTSFAAKLEITDLDFVPISALAGDNVVERSTNMPWFDGQPLLGQLEDVHIASDRNLVDNRFPVQYVIRPQSAEHRDYRGFAGSVVGGIFKQGDEVMVLPSRKTSTIAQIDTPDGAVDQAFPPMAVTMLLDDELDISRGDMICRPTNQPSANSRFEAMICWFDETSSLRTGAPLPAQAHDPLDRRRGRRRCATSSTSTPCTATSTRDARGQRHRPRLDPHHLAALLRRVPAEPHHRQLHPRRPRHQPHRRRRDDHRRRRRAADRRRHSVVADNITFHPSSLSREERCEALGTRGRDDLDDRPLRLRQVDDRRRRRAHAWSAAAAPPTCSTATTSATASTPTSASARRTGPRTCAGSARSRSCWPSPAWSRSSPWSAPTRTTATRSGAAHEAAGIPFFEVFVDTPLEECEQRDPKGLYAKARAGEITDLTGVGSPYEAPERPELTTDPDLETAVRQVLGLLG